MSGTNTTLTTLPANHGAPAAPPSPPTDIDDLAVFEARRAVEEAEAAAAAAAKPPVAPPASTTVPNGPAPAKPAPMVPKGRLDEEMRLRQQLQEEIRQLKGQGAQPRQSTVPATPAPPALTVEQQITAAVLAEHDKILAAAKRFDAGEMTMEQFKQAEFASQNVIASLREQYWMGVIRAEMPKPVVSLTDQQVLQQNVNELHTKHPWATKLNDAEIAFLVDMAKKEFAARGYPIVGGPADTMRLQQAVAELSDTFGPRWYPNATPTAPAPAAGKPPAQRPATPATQPATTQPRPSAAQAGLNKLALANAHPPATHTAGTPRGGQDGLTLERLETMSTDEIADLSPEVLARLVS